MIITDHHERYIHFDPATDEMPPEVWTMFDGRRMRMQPDSLAIRWETDNNTGEWRLARATTYGRRCHKTAGWTLSRVFYEHNQWQTIMDAATPEWVVHHVALSHPLFNTMVYSAVLETVSTILGLSSPPNHFQVNLP